jgi:hypothetical protein
MAEAAKAAKAAKTAKAVTAFPSGFVYDEEELYDDVLNLGGVSLAVRDPTEAYVENVEVPVSNIEYRRAATAPYGTRQWWYEERTRVFAGRHALINTHLPNPWDQLMRNVRSDGLAPKPNVIGYAEAFPDPNAHQNFAKTFMWESVRRVDLAAADHDRAGAVAPGDGDGASAAIWAGGGDATSATGGATADLSMQILSTLGGPNFEGSWPDPNQKSPTHAADPEVDATDPSQHHKIYFLAPGRPELVDLCVADGERAHTDALVDQTTANVRLQELEDKFLASRAEKAKHWTTWKKTAKTAAGWRTREWRSPRKLSRGKTN